MAVPPAATVTLFDLVAPVDGLHVTEYVPAFTLTLSVDIVPLEAPFTENAHCPPTATATSVPFPPPLSAGGGGGAAAAVAVCVAFGAAVGIGPATVGFPVGGAAGAAPVCATGGSAVAVCDACAVS